MKSVTIRDKKGKLMIKILQKKGGEYEIEFLEELVNTLTIDIRDDQGCKVIHRLMGVK